MKKQQKQKAQQEEKNKPNEAEETEAPVESTLKAIQVEYCPSNDYII